MSKLGELILYIASKSQEDPAFGAIKLNKILFTIDFIAYGTFGNPVTEARYIQLEHGPAPAQLLQERKSLLMMYPINRTVK